MEEQFVRTRMLLGSSGVERLSQATVAVFGLGGVGGYAVEALARAGVGHLVLVDHDTISISNLNRQVLALHSTLGLPKVEAARQRVRDINPQCRVEALQCFFSQETAQQFDLGQWDYIIDAIDTVSAKLCLVQQAATAMTPIISCMGTGNKLDPTRLEVADISKTSMCPLARVMRKELGKRNIRHLKVVYSKEEAIAPTGWEAEAAALGKRQIPGSMTPVPGAAGLILAAEVIQALTGAEADCTSTPD